VLDAAIACLIEHGYSGATVRRIAERAGVTTGALQHHFPEKRTLMAGAIGQLNAAITQELVREGLPKRGRPEQLAAQMLDRLWEIHKGPLIQALTELAVAARTDRELRPSLLAAQREADALTAAAGATLFPSAPTRGLPELIGTVLATLRGQALLTYVNPDDPDATWPATRSHLLELLSG